MLHRVSESKEEQTVTDIGNDWIRDLSDAQSSEEGGM